MNIENEQILNFLNFIIKKIDNFRFRSKWNFLFVLTRIFISLRAKLIFIIEDGNWVIGLVSNYIVSNLNQYHLIRANYNRLYYGKNKIIHFGSIHCLIKNNSIIRLDKLNKNILTCFHISPKMEIVKFIPYMNKYIDIMHTSNEITREKLISLGFKKEKVIIIPLGIDLSLFKNYERKNKLQMKKKFKLPLNRIIIGSFQKDGEGRGEGVIPKLIKGPDLFCEVVKRLHEKFKIHVFLTGPARGYVKNKLNEFGIPYTHLELIDYTEMVKCYNTLDLYIITSRVEGGPLALLECMATGVPIISTKVGMAPEIIKNGYNGFIADVEDINKLCEYSTQIIENKELKEKFIKINLDFVQKFDWRNIAEHYYWKLYRKVLI